MNDDWFETLVWFYSDDYIENVLIGTFAMKMWRKYLIRRYRRGGVVQLTATWYVRKVEMGTTDGVLYQVEALCDSVNSFLTYRTASL